MKTEKQENLIITLYDKTEYVIHIRNFILALNNGLVFKILHTIIKFQQKAWLKPYNDMKTDLTKKAKHDFEKDVLEKWKCFGYRHDETQGVNNKPDYFGHSILELSKILMYEFWHDYVKPKYGEKAQLCFMDTDSFIVYIETDNIYENIAEDVETRFDTSNYELDRPLPNGKIKK